MSNDQTDGSAGSPALSEDEKRLHQLGYAQELSRTMSGFSNFAVSFTIISILSGCLTLYGFGLNTGGPVMIVWGWPVVGLMTLLVGLAMAEVCSSFPTAGGLYYWSAKLAPSNGAAWSWFTGWFNFLGQVAVTAGIDFGAAFFLNALLDLQFGFSATPGHTILLFGIILLVHALLNSVGVKLVAKLNDVSVWWHIIGVLFIVVVLAFVPDRHQSAGFVFGHFVNNTGWGSTFYVAMLGLLLAQYTFTGYDASAHMTEETHDAARSGPRGIVMSIVVSLVAGWVLLIGLTFAIQSYDSATGTDTGVPPAQIFIDAVGSSMAKVLLVVVVGAQLFCGMSSVTANSRMIYAFSRDGALPGSSLLAQDQPEDAHTHQRDLARRGRRVPARTAVPVERHRVRRGHLDRGDRALHRLRDPDLAAVAAGGPVRARALAPRAVEQADRRGGDRLGRLHHDPVHAAAGQPGQWEHFQLHPDRRAGRARLRRDLVAGLGAEVVHRPEGPGFGGGTRRDRARSRVDLSCGAFRSTGSLSVAARVATYLWRPGRFSA